MYKNRRENWKSLRENHYYQLKQNWLNEEKHLYSPSINTILKFNIDEKIWRNRNNPLQKIFKNKYTTDIPQHAIEFIFDEPFKNEPVFAAIDKLKIYLVRSYDDSFAVLDNNINDLVLPQYEPMIKITGNHIQVLSVFICIEPEYFIGAKESFINEFNTKLSHELTHAIDSIKDKIGFIKSGSLNELISLLSKYNDKVDEEEITKNIQIQNVYSFIWIMKELLYYTQKTEIAAYLDTFYNQLQNTKTTNISDIEIYDRYSKRYELLQYLIENKNIFQKKYFNQIEYILDKLQIIKNQQLSANSNFENLPDSFINAEFSFGKLLRYFNNQLLRYLKNAQDIFDKFADV